MAREALVTLYLLLFRIIFTICKLFPQKNKTVCVASFGDNIDYTATELHRISDGEIIFLQDPSSTYPLDEKIGPVLTFGPLHPFMYIRGIYHLATATTVLVDNYFVFLAAARFRTDTTCIQLWHAAGAMKQFGWGDPATGQRSQKARRRFQRVYDAFDHTIVGSEKMADIFKYNFALPDERILRTGIPRTDLFFRGNDVQEIITSIREAYPESKEKKILLYAPTYRKNDYDGELHLDIDRLRQAFQEEYVLWVRHHPTEAWKTDLPHPDFVRDVSSHPDMNHLLLMCDLLITDYSSIPFEFAFLGRPMVFFAYDLDQYRNENGILSDYTEEIPGPLVRSTDELIHSIRDGALHESKITRFHREWNEYSIGQSSRNVARFILENHPDA